MLLDQYQILFSYHFDTLARLLDQIGRLTPSQREAQSDQDQRSLLQVSFHILDTDYGWREGLETGERPATLPRDVYTGPEKLRDLLARERAAWREYFDTLSDEIINQEISLSAGPDRVLTVPRWKVLQHLLFHGMQHQAEIAARLTSWGHSPGDIDFIFYQRE